MMMMGGGGGRVGAETAVGRRRHVSGIKTLRGDYQSLTYGHAPAATAAPHIVNCSALERERERDETRWPVQRTASSSQIPMRCSRPIH